jgi:hypothetical protein
MERRSEPQHTDDVGDDEIAELARRCIIITRVWRRDPHAKAEWTFEPQIIVNEGVDVLALLGRDDEREIRTAVRRETAA